MSTTSQVRAAWEAAVFNSATVQGWGTRCHFYEPDDGGGESESAKRYANGRIDYLVVLVRRSTLPLGTSGLFRYRFDLEAQLTLQQTEQDGETFTAVADRLDALADLVASALGDGWGGTVHWCEPRGADGPAPAAVDGQRCWRGLLRYQAFFDAQL